MDDFKRLRQENQSLKEAVERLRRERDAAEELYASSRAEFTKLEHDNRKQAFKIVDLEADIKAIADLNPRPRTIPTLPADVKVIEISDGDDDEDRTERANIKRDDGLEDTAGQAQLSKGARQFMDHVSIKAVSVEPTARDSGSSDASLLPGRFKRSRSPAIGSSSSLTLADSFPTRRTPPPGASSSSAPLVHLHSTAPEASPSIKRQKKSNLRNPKTEIKKEAFTLPQHVADEYLRDTPNLAIVPPALNELYVPRKFLRLEYGGSDMHFIVHFRLENRGRAAVFPESTLNPFLPTHPGAAGLIFARRPEIEEAGPWALFCKDRPSGGAVWRYMGNYETEVCGRPTPEQFQGQTHQVKQKWGSYIRDKKKSDVYVAMRARIALRKAGHDITDDTVEREVENIRRKRGFLPVTAEDIIQALERGDEWINIIRMKCVSYDHDFAAEMARRFDGWEAPPAGGSRRGQAKSKTASKDKGKRRAAPSSRRRRAVSHESDSGSEFYAESEDGSERHLSENESCRI